MANDPSPKLWPQPIPVLGLTGEHASGKTTLGLSISPNPSRVRIYDIELSAVSYAALGFDYVNVPAEMLKKHPKGYKPIDLWNWWLNDIRELPAGKYDVIQVDPITDLETGLTDWVENNPQHFGHSTGQYSSMSAIKWGDVKAYLKLVLTGFVAAKCQTFVFIAHMGAEFGADKKPTGKRVPKGKETLDEVAHLYLQLERKSRSGCPSATVLKSRVSKMTMGTNGPEFRDIMPPRLPVATPEAIREYMRSVIDPAKLKPEEQAKDESLSADERLILETRKAEAERDAAQARGGVKAEPAPVATPSPVPAKVEHVGGPTADLDGRAHMTPQDPNAPDEDDTPAYQSPVSATFRGNALSDIAKAKDVTELKKVGEEIGVLTRRGSISKEHRDEINPVYAARMKELKAAAGTKS